MSTVAELLTWASHGDALKSYLGISGSSEDATLQLYLGALVEQIDLYLELDDDGFDTLPSSVQLAAFEGLEVMLSRKGSSGLAEVQTQALRQRFFAANAFAADASFMAMRALLRPYKTRRWLDGA